MFGVKWCLVFAVAAVWCNIVWGVTPSPYWKTDIIFPDDAFRAEGIQFNPESPGFIKFTILLSEAETVYFQDCQKYPFHHGFASEILDPFLGISPQDYDQVTLHASGQQAILGAVILPPQSAAPPQEYGIQLIRADAYTPDEVIALFNLVKAHVQGPSGMKAWYFPSFEQSAVAEANEAYLADHGVAINSSARWSSGNVVYSEGWALGRVTYVPGGEIEAAFASGTLLSTDILLTEGVPAEVPMVAGILSLTPSTPNSHVAILANTYNVPFAYLKESEDAALAQSLVGQRVALRAYAAFLNHPDIRLIPADDLDSALIQQILALKVPAPLDISPMRNFGDWTAPVAPLEPGDFQYFGGKATNMALLRTAIPDNSPVSMAISFDLWKSFLDQTLPGGSTLRHAIHARLDTYTYPPSDIAALKADLAAVRDLIRDAAATSFTEAARAGVLGALQDPQFGFAQNRYLRFRSSTNVEDGAQFTGAGLYDSYSGCLADELDGDDTGPCACEADESNERGVFRAIRRVFASFYNDNAFLERLRHDIDEDTVGMAILVHHSFPDEEEQANGVATLDKLEMGASIHLVTQLGAVSVSNPENGALPEEVEVQTYAGESYVGFLKPSSLVPIGATVLDWEEDYRQLGDLMMSVAERFAAVTGRTEFLLDLEYKKNAPDGKLIIKQVREVPRPNTNPSLVPFLLREPVALQTFQGEYGDVFANHRLKTRLHVETASLALSPEQLQQSFFTQVEMTYAADGKVHTQSGPLTAWPNFAHSYSEETSTDSWSFDDLANPRAYVLRAQFPALVAPSQNPLLTILDANFGLIPLEVNYANPEQGIDWAGEPTTILTDTVLLTQTTPPQEGELLQERICESGDGVKITTSFYWPAPPRGVSAGYTAPLVRWVETEIEGYTTSPILLTGFYSQTYRPEHHNFAEHFLFEPQLEPGISAATLAELRAANIRLIHCFRDSEGASRITTFGFDGGEGEGEGEGEGDLAVELLAVFHQADTNGDGKISRAESAARFPASTELQFDDLDSDGDGFLIRAELGDDSPGGCFGPGSGADALLLGVLAYVVLFRESRLRFPFHATFGQ